MLSSSVGVAKGPLRIAGERCYCSPSDAACDFSGIHALTAHGKYIDRYRIQKRQPIDQGRQLKTESCEHLRR